MKKTKRIATVLLALVMVLSLSVCAFAHSGSNANNGEITISNAVVGYDYTIYQILALESYNTESGAYAYKATADWASFVNSDAIKGVYLNVDGQGYVTWVEGASESDFAALAKVHAKTLGSNQGSVKATSATVKFSNLNLGYYLVDSSLGALCSLDTTNPTVTIMEKNGAPTIDKAVQEDSTGLWGDKNDASIGDIVNFKATINVIDGQPKNYVMHDTMSAGLTFQPNSVKVTVNGNTLLVGLADIRKVHLALVGHVHIGIEGIALCREILQHTGSPQIHVGEEGMDTELRELSLVLGFTTVILHGKGHVGLERVDAGTQDGYT